jgi:hypothetical protein
MPKFTITYPARCLCKLPVFLRIGYRTSRSRLRCWSRSARHTTADPTAAHQKSDWLRAWGGSVRTVHSACLFSDLFLRTQIHFVPLVLNSRALRNSSGTIDHMNLLITPRPLQAVQLSGFLPW